MNKFQGPATVLLRLALATGFLSAVASRLGLWGSHSSGWSSYLAYAKSVNSYAPDSLIPLLAILSTILEFTFGILLLIRYKTRGGISSNTQILHRASFGIPFVKNPAINPGNPICFNFPFTKSCI